MTGFALGDKFIGVSTDNIYTKQELDTKLQDKQNTLTAGQGIDISEDGTISVDVTSAEFGLGAQAPLQYTSAQYATSVEINKEAGTFTRKLTLPSTSARETPYKGQSQNNTKWYLTGTYNSDNQTVTINTAQTLYAECPTTSNVTFRFDPPFNDTSYGSRACVIFGYKDENGNITHLGNVTYTVSTTTHTLHGGYQTVSSLVSKGGIYTQESNGISEMVIAFDQHLENLSTNQIPTENFYIILRTYRQGSTGNQMYYICFKDATTDETIYNEGFMVSEQMPDLNFFCLSTTDDVAYPITGRARVVGDDRTNQYVWTVEDGVSPNTLKLNYDGSLTLDSSNNLKVNVENLGLATVATTGSYMDLTNTPEEYVLPTASTHTLGGVKVDGTSIVISDGVISTNTGTEVDTYTKGEVDILLAKKEDNITATQPLALEQKTSNTGSVGFTVSESNTLMPSSDVISLNYSLSSPTTIASTFNNYIVIPYSYLEKTVIRIPCNSSSLPSNSTSAFLGYLEDGVVQPLVYFPICWSTNNASTNYVYTMDTNNPNASTGTHPSNTAGSYYADGFIGGKYYSCLTTYYSPEWTQYGLTSYTKSGDTDGQDMICFQRYNFDTTEEKAAIEKANCVVISYGGSLNQFPIDLNICGKFPYKGDFATGAAIPYDAPLGDVADLTDNRLDFTTVTTNELALNIDNSTIKVNDSGQLYADVSLPETITTQGNTFNGVNQLVQLDDEGKLPAIDGSQLTNLPSGTAPANMVTTDTQQTITATKTIQDLKISGQSRQSVVLKTGAISYPNRYFIDIGDNDGAYNYIRLISQGEVEVVNTTGSRWGKVLDTVNFATRVIAGSGINITKTNQGSTGDDVYTISSTGGGESPDSLNVYQLQYGAQSGSIPVTFDGNNITIKSGIPISTPNGTFSYTSDITYSYSFTTERTIFAYKDDTDESYYNMLEVHYGGSQPATNADGQIAWFDNGVWKMISATGEVTAFSTEQLTPIAHVYLSGASIKSIDYASYYKINIELPDNVLTSSNISQDAYIQQLEARIAALEALIDGGNSTTTTLNLSPTPNPQVNDAVSETGYTAIDEITVQDGEAE